MSLFKFQTSEERDSDGNVVVKAGADIIIPNKHVNVVNDYAWTIQPKSARKDVPYLYMIERKLTNDVMMQQLAYNLVASYELGNQLTKEAFVTIEKSLSEDEKDEIRQQNERARAAQVKNNKIITKAVKDKGMFNLEDPYTGLYNLEDTGWVYTLPYFSEGNHDIGGNWGLPSEGESGGIMSNITNAATEALGNLATDVNKITSALGSLSGSTSIVRPGTYIEQAKQYNFSPQGASYSLTFNLYNTGKIQDVIDNWELCFALMYNLLPNRRTKTVFDPPPLYEIYIPGVRRSPVSYIKGMRVSFLGATRLMDLDLPTSSGGRDKIRTIVPDAYSIQIDIEDVLPESKNFMQSMVDETKRIKISTKAIKSSATPATPSDELEDKANNITHITLNPTQKTGVSDTNSSTPVDNITNNNISESGTNSKISTQRTAKDTIKSNRGRF
jgi:hypothetical protein